MSEAGPRHGRLRWLLLVVVPVLFLLGGGAAYLHGGRFVETDNAFVKADMVLVAAERAGRVVAIEVRENERVRAGQVLVRFDDAEAALEVASAEAGLAQRQVEIEALRASYREKQAEIALAETRLQFARRHRERQADLVRQRFAPASTFDDARQAEQEADRQLAALRESLGRLATQLGGGPQTPVDDHPSVRAAQAALERARLAREQTVLCAPLDGVVSRLPLPGRYLSAGQPALSLVAVDSVWIEANFSESDLTHMRAGQKATVRIDAHPGVQWAAEVASLSPATGAEFAILPPQNATGNWVKVPQRLPVRLRLRDTADRPELRAGLSAVVEVDTGHRRTLFGWRP